MKIYPLLLEPFYMDYVWGGRRMARTYGRKGTPDVCAESWEISDRPEGVSMVVNGPEKGRSLHELVEAMGADLLGKQVDAKVFPLLIKIIDAKADLSVQVHPSNANAHVTGGEAKTEMWIVLDAEPGSTIYAGLKPGVTQEAFEAALAAGKLEKVALAGVPAKPGRAVFVPGGKVHAIGAGCLLLEVQQNSNTTYRVYDWGRVGHDGKPRPLHMEQALQVIDWENASPEVVPPRPITSTGDNQWWDLVACPFFRTKRVELRGPEDVVHEGNSFHALFVTKGTVLIGANGHVASAPAGTSCLVPAAAMHYTLTPVSGSASVIQITL
ncbi:MAG: class I mannose-6-phosphate isomerase [Verrucomicrobia bacterium]|jgi:mannose-6-phosphate isomerase|nr:class I mannose-6-phosphate isomerase [Verrucomicrobiota bacterium]